VLPEEGSGVTPRHVRDQEKTPVENLRKAGGEVSEEVDTTQNSRGEKKCVSSGCRERALECEVWHGQPVCVACLAGKAVAENRLIVARLTEIQEVSSNLKLENQALKYREKISEKRIDELELRLLQKDSELADARARLSINCGATLDLTREMRVV
jgi:hypothetical protein